MSSYNTMTGINGVGVCDPDDPEVKMTPWPTLGSGAALEPVPLDGITTKRVTKIPGGVKQPPKKKAAAANSRKSRKKASAVVVVVRKPKARGPHPVRAPLCACTLPAVAARMCQRRAGLRVVIGARQMGGLERSEGGWGVCCGEGVCLAAQGRNAELLP
jgi:hypothetical protein